MLTFWIFANLLRKSCDSSELVGVGLRSKYAEILEFTEHSTGLSLGKQVDGLPSARQSTEAVEASHGGLGPEPI